MFVGDIGNAVPPVSYGDTLRSFSFRLTRNPIVSHAGELTNITEYENN